MAVAVIMGAAWSVGPYLFDSRDYAEGLDSKPVRAEAKAACTDMTAAVDAPGADAETQNQAIEAMVARLRALGPETLRKDRPAESWLADWDALLAARRAGGTNYTVPLMEDRDGVMITRRMDDLVKDIRECTVPKALYPPRPF